MASPGVRLEESRQHLCRAIIEALASWPEAHRRVFINSHYRGDNPESISRACGLPVEEIARILTECETRLREAVRSFKDNGRPALRLAYSRPPSGTPRS
jgi:DNA-directed RNA polymerase specialized sigma24 family protein